jgi:hypothetical protein
MGQPGPITLFCTALRQASGWAASAAGCDAPRLRRSSACASLLPPQLSGARMLGSGLVMSAQLLSATFQHPAPLSTTPCLPRACAALQSLQSFPLPEYSGSASGAGVVADPLFGSALTCSQDDSDLVGLRGCWQPGRCVWRGHAGTPCPAQPDHNLIKTAPPSLLPPSPARRPAAGGPGPCAVRAQRRLYRQPVVSAGQHDG